jgi:hypothetical protein
MGLMGLRDLETMGTADAAGDFKGIPDLVGKLYQRHKWRQGRGGPDITHIPELFTMEMVHNPERRSFFDRLFKKRSWVPQKIYDVAQQKVKEYGDIVDRALLDRKGYYPELMNIFNIGSIVTRAGWRIEHLQDAVKDILKSDEFKLNFDERKTKWGKNEWETFFDVASKKHGVSSLWFYVGARVDAEMSRALGEVLGYDHEVPGHEVHEYFIGKRAFEEIFEITDPNGQRRKVNFYDFRQAKEWEVKGEIFQRFLKRSPGDFLLNLTQLVPELMKPDSDLWKSSDEIRKKYKKDSHKIKQAEALQGFVKERWGDEGFTQLEQVKNWFSKITDKDTFFEKLGTALEKARAVGRIEMIPEDIDDKDAELRELVFGKDGIVTYLKNQDEDFGDYDRVGNYGFFYNVGRAWSIKQGAANPNATDLDYASFYQKISKAGETVTRRLHSDVHMWDEVVKNLADLDHILYKAAASKNLEEIYKLHGGIHQLEGVVGEDEAKHANYLLASLVTSYFWEHNMARAPGGVVNNLLTKLALRRKVSLSKIHGGIYAYSWSDNEVRDYHRYLAFDVNATHQDGRWSYKQAQLSFDAKTDTFIVGDVLPSILTALSAYIMYVALKKALEEETVEKRR